MRTEIERRQTCDALLMRQVIDIDFCGRKSSTLGGEVTDRPQVEVNDRAFVFSYVNININIKARTNDRMMNYTLDERMDDFTLNGISRFYVKLQVYFVDVKQELNVSESVVRSSSYTIHNSYENS